MQQKQSLCVSIDCTSYGPVTTCTTYRDQDQMLPMHHHPLDPSWKSTVNFSFFMIGVPVQGTFVLIVGVWPNRWRRLFGSLPIRNAPPVLRHPVPVALTHLRASFRCSYEKCFRCHNEFPDVFNHRISVLVACHCDKLCSAGQSFPKTRIKEICQSIIFFIYFIVPVLF